MSWNSLFVGRNFPVAECRETRRVGPREGVGRENLAPPAGRARANSLYFPCRSGNSLSETGSLSTAPTAIQSATPENPRPVREAGGKFLAISRGSGRSGSACPRRRDLDDARDCAAAIDFLYSRLRRFGFVPIAGVQQCEDRTARQAASTSTPMWHALSLTRARGESVHPVAPALASRESRGS
jgi:hypothetical protein